MHRNPFFPSVFFFFFLHYHHFRTTTCRCHYRCHCSLVLKRKQSALLTLSQGRMSAAGAALTATGREASTTASDLGPLLSRLPRELRDGIYDHLLPTEDSRLVIVGAVGEGPSLRALLSCLAFWSSQVRCQRDHGGQRCDCHTRAAVRCSSDDRRVDKGWSPFAEIMRVCPNLAVSQQFRAEFVDNYLRTRAFVKMEDNASGFEILPFWLEMLGSERAHSIGMVGLQVDGGDPLSEYPDFVLYQCSRRYHTMKLMRERYQIKDKGLALFVNYCCPRWNARPRITVQLVLGDAEASRKEFDTIHDYILSRMNQYVEQLRQTNSGLEEEAFQEEAYLVSWFEAWVEKHEQLIYIMEHKWPCIRIKEEDVRA